MTGEGRPLIWATMLGRRLSQVSRGGKVAHDFYVDMDRNAG
jgi:hypothetical protein